MLDALKEGLKVFILTDAIAEVEQAQRILAALEEMVNSGAKETTSEDLFG